MDCAVRRLGTDSGPQFGNVSADERFFALEASADFTHLVAYTPPGENFFCIENQTCSTDAHNLNERGFVRESGLKTVAPGATRGGSVTYAVNKTA